MDPVVWVCIAVVVALLLATPPSCFYGGAVWERRANAGDLALEKFSHLETRQERDEWRKRHEQLEQDTEVAIRRAAAGAAHAQELGGILADPDDDAAFERLLRLRSKAGGGHAAPDAAAGGLAQAAPTDGGRGA